MRTNLLLLVTMITMWMISLQAQEIEPDFQNEEPSYSIGIENTVSSKYVWNGINYNEGVVVQPELWLTFGQFTFDVWSSYTARDKNDAIKRHEVDLGVYYEHSFGDLVLTSGFVYYLYPEQDDSPSTAELIVNATYPLTEQFQFETELTADVLEYTGIFYGYHGINYTLEINENYSFEAKAGFGWANNKFNNDYIGIDKRAINFTVIGAAISTSVLGPFSIKPFIEYYQIPNSEISELIGNNSFNYGLNIGFEL